jgi:hypothetical protein
MIRGLLLVIGSPPRPLMAPRFYGYVHPPPCVTCSGTLAWRDGFPIIMLNRILAAL